MDSIGNLWYAHSFVHNGECHKTDTPSIFGTPSFTAVLMGWITSVPDKRQISRVDHFFTLAYDRVVFGSGVLDRFKP